jgi:hypothetical protein
MNRLILVETRYLKSAEPSRLKPYIQQENEPSGDVGQELDECRSIGRGNQGFVLSPRQKMEKLNSDGLI